MQSAHDDEDIAGAVADAMLLLTSEESPEGGPAAVLRALRLHLLELRAVRRRWGWQTERDIADILLRPKARHHHVDAARRALEGLLAEFDPSPVSYFSWRLVRESDGALTLDDTRARPRDRLTTAKIRLIDRELVAVHGGDRAHALWIERDRLCESGPL